MSTLAGRVVALLVERGEHVACAESLTGGLLCAGLVAVPGASAVVRGGVVAYATDVKAVLLGVDPDLLAAHGAVHPDVARAMAAGAARELQADWGVSTTGVAGPAPQDGQAVGTVHVAVHRASAGHSAPAEDRTAAGRTAAADRSTGGVQDAVRSLQLAGDRTAVRVGAVDAAMELLLQRLRGDD